MDDFLIESKAHGWPSFRDAETNWENVRVLRDGETVSVDGTHLGHNLPDRHGNRYCISKFFLPEFFRIFVLNDLVSMYSNYLSVFLFSKFSDLVSVAGNEK